LLEAGTAAVWVIDPYFQTITVYRNHQPPRMYSGNDSIGNEDYLPGFREAVVRFFKR